MQEAKLVSYILDLGEILLTAGAEVSRVEDTLVRIGKAYGFKKTDVFTITSTIILTVQLNENNITTQTRRIKNYKTNFEQIECVNQLSRDICKEIPKLAKLKNEIDKIKYLKKYSKKTILFSYVLISSSFSVFFGGNVFDSFASGITGFIIYFTLELLNKIKMNNIVISLISSMITALSAIILSGVGIGKSIDKIIIGNIMLLIPGIAFTVSLRDMINGDIISGMLGLFESLLKAVAVAIGFGLVLIPIGG